MMSSENRSPFRHHVLAINTELTAFAGSTANPGFARWKFSLS